MDPARFDILTRSLHDMRSRRGILGSLLGAALGLHGLVASTAKKGKGKGNGKKKRKRTSPALPPGPTCTDRLTNGSESDVDCGGTCPRCANGKTCRTANDCTNACPSGTCQACATTPECGNDGGGQCSCDTPLPNGPKICTSQRGRSTATSCFSVGCAAGSGTVCVVFGPGEARCVKPCGAP